MTYFIKLSHTNRKVVLYMVYAFIVCTQTLREEDSVFKHLLVFLVIILVKILSVNERGDGVD